MPMPPSPSTRSMRYLEANVCPTFGSLADFSSSAGSSVDMRKIGPECEGCDDDGKEAGIEPRKCSPEVDIDLTLGEEPARAEAVTAEVDDEGESTPEER